MRARPGSRTPGRTWGVTSTRVVVKAPEVADGLGHLDADGAGADDDGVAHFALGDLVPDGHGGGEVRDVHDPGEVGPGHGQGAGAAAGGQDQLVIGEVFLPAGFQIKDPHLPLARGQWPGPGCGF